ncbi:cobalt-precorrin-6A reductase [Pseudonocardia sp. GCM10023141]|uniref:cobalt-precorrin-6A reductase n=1 Tax=Pseudonocardia sp. GCM10023141 TaxID=3252653 RepID=UPI0036165C2D
MNVVILGGTREARQLAEALESSGYTVISTLATRPPMAELPAGDARIGGFGGVDGFTGWLRDGRIDAVVDATHPFAERMTANAVAATTALGLPLLLLYRDGWVESQGDRWTRVPDPAAAAAVLPELGRRVFLTSGRRGLDAFAVLDDLWFLMRSAAPLVGPLPQNRLVMVRSGPFTADAERALMREHRIDVLVSRDSGGEITAAKLVAARELGLPVVLVERPPLPPGERVRTVGEARRWLAARRG